MLKQAIANGTITDDTDKDALFNSHREYKKWDKAQFKRNLKALIKASKNPKKNKKKWFKSKAKNLLRKDIIEKKVTDASDPAVVYQMRPEYSDFEFARFKVNLANLIEVVYRDYERMRNDCEFYGHDLGVLTEIQGNEIQPKKP